MNYLGYLFGLLLMGLFFPACEQPINQDNKEVGLQKTIILVRHAEKDADGTDDPGLLPEGHQRAERLADHFRDWSMDQILSTRYQRCSLTVAPLAVRQKKEIEIFEVQELWPLIENIRSSEHQSILISGHSDINPKIINYLLGEDVLEELPSTEYDGIYFVFLHEDGSANLRVMRY